MRKRGTMTLLAGAAGVLLLSTAAVPADVTVTIPANQPIFYPRVVVINQNDTVTWQNASNGMFHTVTSDPGSGATFDHSLPAGGTASHTFDSAGIFPYHCTPHASLGMRGIVIVGSARTARSSSEIAVTLGAWNFEGEDATTVTDVGASIDTRDTRTITAGTRNFRASVPLPAGALITGIEVAGCDDNAGDISAELRECIDPPVASGVCNVVASATLTGDICGFASSGATSWTVDNFGYTYNVKVNLPTDTHELRSVRVFYKKQISPAPLTASFADVPTTHPQFQFIQALVAAGITAGCGGGNYCPNNSVTRAQMAVFMSRLGGLFWPN